jgi:hypothetical protein
MVVAKEQKVSEFRQAWIDALRDDIADLIAHANLIHAELVKFAEEEEPDKREYLKRTRDKLCRNKQIPDSYKLRLNPAEEEKPDTYVRLRCWTSKTSTKPTCKFSPPSSAFALFMVACRRYIEPASGPIASSRRFEGSSLPKLKMIWSGSGTW